MGAKGVCLRLPSLHAFFPLRFIRRSARVSSRVALARLLPLRASLAAHPVRVAAGSKVGGEFVIGAAGTRVLFDKANEVGSGGFSHVFRGSLKGGEPCAVK